MSAPVLVNYPDRFKPKVLAVTVLEIERIVNWLNLKDHTKPSAEVMKDWAKTLLKRFNCETLEDFILFFDMIRDGRLKLKFYERFGCDVLIDAFEKYLLEVKTPVREKLVHNTQAQHKKLSDSITDSSGWTRVREALEANMKAEKPKKSELRKIRAKVDKQEVKEWLDRLAISEIRGLEKQYFKSRLRYDRSGVTIATPPDKHCKLIESRLTLLAIKKALLLTSPSNLEEEAK